MMSEEDKELLETRRVELQKHVGLEDGLLLAHLRSRGALTLRQEQEIKSEHDAATQVGRLLDLLQRGDCDTLDKLVYSLWNTQQSHVAKERLRLPNQPDSWIQTGDPSSTGPSTGNILSEADTKLLERSRPHLMEKLRLKDGHILAQLRGREVITPTEEDHVKEEKGGSNGVGLLVNIILRKRPESLEAFIHTLNHAGYSKIVEKHLRPPTTPDLFQPGRFVQGGSSTDELEDSLKENLTDKLQEWKTELEGSVSDQGGNLDYIDQPCSVVDKKKSEQQSHISRASKLVEDSSPGDRIFLYGEAGMGKTTLLKHIAHFWVDKSNSVVAEKFKYAFFIPMRHVGNIPLLNVICDELKLIPGSNSKKLKESLDLHERRILFLLDSYEELPRHVVNKEIDDLITSKLFPKSTVVVTSRPGSKLNQSQLTSQAGSKLNQSGSQKIGRLEDLPETEVKQKIKQYLHENEDVVERVIGVFPAMSFLQRPINLSLFLYVVKNDKHTKVLDRLTQAELFNQVLQYLMLAYAKKRHFEEFTPGAGSYLKNKEIPKDIKRLFRDIARTCYEEKKENNMTLRIDEVDDMKEYIDFGLFTAGPDENSLVLPHPLFQEYFAAAHLAENRRAWKDFLEMIRKRSTSDSQRPLLVDVLRELGMENVVRFVVALAPEISEDVGRLFVIERRRIEGGSNYRLVNFQYYIELLRDCSDESGKRVLATALATAPVRDMLDPFQRFWDTEGTSPALLRYLDYNQCAILVKNIHNIELGKKDDTFTLSCTGANKRLQLGDKFVVALVCWYNCTIIADELKITGLYGYHSFHERLWPFREDPYAWKMGHHYLDLPGCMLSRNISGVRQLTLKYCTLCRGFPEHMSVLDESQSAQTSTPCSENTNNLLEKVHLYRVSGLQNCDVITSRPCQLEMYLCGDVKASTLMTCFLNLSSSELSLYGDTTVMYDTEEELTSGISTVNTGRRLNLSSSVKGGPLSMPHLLDILADREELEILELSMYTLSWSVSDTNEAVMQNNTLNELVIENCKADLDQLLKFCSHCRQLERIVLSRCDIVFFGKVESVKRLPGLQRFTMYNTSVHGSSGDDVEELMGRLCPLARLVITKL